MKAAVVILVLGLVLSTLAQSRYTTYCVPNNEGEGVQASRDMSDFRYGELSIDDAFNAAAQTENPHGLGCCNLATYETQEDLDAILQSMFDAGAVYSTIGGRKTGSIFYWAAGQRNGRAIFDQSGDPSVCLQEFCLYDNYEILPQYEEDQLGLNLVLYFGGEFPDIQLVPAAGANCYTVECPETIVLPAADGSPALTLWPEALSWFEMQEAMIQNRGFIARIESAAQNAALTSSFQCANQNYYVWLGYYASSNKLRLGAGPDSGEILASGIYHGDCGEHFCNFREGEDFDENEAAAFNLYSGTWELLNPQIRLFAFFQQETCPQAGGGNAYVCIPQGGTWSATLPADQAQSMVRAGTAYWPGGPFRFTTDGHTYYLYLDCNCEIDQRLSQTCLSSDNPQECAVIDINQLPFPGDMDNGNNSWRNSDSLTSEESSSDAVNGHRN